MLYSHASELAIRAALYLALQPPGKLSPVHEIAEGTGLSEPYLAKILRRLTASGLVRAFRGPGRGMELGRAPETISLLAVVRAMEGPAPPDWCGLGLQLCTPDSPCPLHHRWVPLRGEIERLLSETTLGMLAHSVREEKQPQGKSWVPAVRREEGVAGTRSRKLSGRRGGAPALPAWPQRPD